MRITKARLAKLGACDEALVKYFSDRKSWEAKDLLDAAIKNKDYSMACWGLANLMSREQRVRWAIYNAKSVLKIFEDKYPDDKRPRKAIAAAQKYLKYPTEENRKAAAAYAVAAYAAAADAAAAYAAAAYAAADAADAAYAYAAADAAADAAYAAAAYAADAADAAAAASAAYAAAYAKHTVKLLKKGLGILEAT